jgi:DNA damage-binding protein 1
VLKHSRTVYGKVTMLQKLRPGTSPTDHLFVGTDRYTYFTVSWNPSSKQLVTEKSYIDQSDKVGRDSQTADRCLIDPLRRYLLLELFEGVLTVIPIVQKARNKAAIQIGSLGDPILSRISELFVRSSGFLYPRSRNPEKEKAKLAILYEDNQQKIRLKFRTLNHDGTSDTESADFETEGYIREDLDLGASHILPVPGPTCRL